MPEHKGEEGRGTANDEEVDLDALGGLCLLNRRINLIKFTVATSLNSNLERKRHR